ncbi:NAD-dependent epimerase/dehydratase family protein [Dietzia maris]|uniref:NAD-dependent epimerase/dehydratase family protein n=1 Tax=Dietzia maris TaxID=37915 RepID=UPI0021AF5076|nr:NAD-dependent epimerase/dehydratase family protein [Dietzia maris]MCT1434636.1 NAD-dependent epimerase/dehydratase family protein [Dietzia maris]MCT1521823.1 NAD-dependent epimerase/dehydratase family protein [Dietzia maris]
MKVLVTGGSGFLGRGVVAGLAAAGHEVTSGDLLVPDGPGDAGVRHVRLDVTAVSAAVAGHHAVVHLASIVDPDGMGRHAAYRVDVDGSRHVLDACVEHGVGRLVVSSSGAAYGYHPDNPVPITEGHPVRGTSAFAYSHQKALVEHLLADARREHPELEQVVLRIGTILGDAVDNQITALFHRRRLLAVRGSDSPFVFIWDTDLVAIVVRAVGDGPPGTFNVAGTGTLTIHQIAARLGKRTLAIPEPVLDNTRLRTVFGYTPELTSAEAFDRWLAGHPDARA